MIVLVPGATAQWTTENIFTYGTNDEPQGVTIETQPLTGRWMVAYAIQDGQTQGFVNTTVTEDAFTTRTDNEVFSESEGTQALVTLGGMSTSLDSMAFCITELIGSGGNTSLRLATSSGGQLGTGLFDVVLINNDMLDNGECDTGLARNSLRSAPAVSLVWVANPDGGNGTKFIRLNENREIIVGPEILEGEFFVGVDERQWVAVPGHAFVNPTLIREPDAPDESCPANIFSKLICLGGKAVGAVVDAASATFDFFKGLLFGGDEDPTGPIVDVYSMAIAGGQRVDPEVQHEVGVTGHTFLLEETDQKPPSIVRSTKNINFFAGDNAIVDDYTAMSVWNDRRGGVFEMSMTDLLNGPASPKTMFSWPNNTVDHIRLKAFDAEIRQSENIGGAFVDSSNDTVWFFHTSDQGETWNVSQVANDYFAVDQQTFSVHNFPVDIAYDRSRDRVVIAYQADDGIKVAHKEFIITPRAATMTNDLTGFLDPETEEELSETIAFGIDILPLSESTGFGIFGTKLFLGFLVVAMGVVGMRGATNRPTMCVTLGGGLGLVTAIALGLVGFWSVTIMTVFLTAAIVLFRRLEGRTQEGVMPAGE